MDQMLSVSEAAERLGLSSARARAMATRGQIEARKVGGRWLVDAASVDRRRARGGRPGRPFSSANAWLILDLASGEEPPGSDPALISRLRRSLRLEGLEDLAPRLGGRGGAKHFRSHPGEVPHVSEDPSLVLSGASAARSFDIGLAPGREVDGYLSIDELDDFVERHALSPAGVEGNVVLRVVPDAGWPVLEGRLLAPEAAVVLDLAESPDPRSASEGRSAVRRLDRRLRRG